MKLVLRIILIAVVAAGGGCNVDDQVSASIVPQYTSTDEKLYALARYQSGPLKITVAFAAKTIGPEGGSISILGFEAVVPPGAVAKATRFTIRLPIDPQNSEYVRAEFGPHGQVFAVPVTLRLPLAGTTSEGNEARVLWWDGATWQPFQTVLLADGRIETKTSHFSEYGTEDTQTSKGIILGNRPCMRSCTK